MNKNTIEKVVRLRNSNFMRSFVGAQKSFSKTVQYLILKEYATTKTICDLSNACDDLLEQVILERSAISEHIGIIYIIIVSALNEA